MINGLYSSASGMIVHSRMQEILASNLATSMLPGGKRENAIIRSFPDVTLNATYKGIPESLEDPRFTHAVGRVGTGAGIDWVYTDYTKGHMVHTGNQNDVALMEDGYFTVLTPDGARYSRNGHFYRDVQGRLVTPEGHWLAGQGANSGGRIGPITVNSNNFFITDQGNVYEETYDPVTQLPTGRQFVDQIRIVDVDNPDLLFKEGNNLYRLDADAATHLRAPARLKVAQGYSEQANSVPTTEMIYLMDSQRAFEANARVLRSSDETLRLAVQDVGRVQG